MINLKDAITHAKEVAKEFREKAKLMREANGLFYPKDFEDCETYAENHEQLAEWLTELEADKKLLSAIRSIIWNNSLYDGIKIDKLRRLIPDCDVYPKHCKNCPDLTCPHSKRGEKEWN